MKRFVQLLVLMILSADPGFAVAPKKTPTATQGSATSKAKKSSNSKQNAAKGNAKDTAAQALQKAIVGKWAQIGGEDIVEFTKGGMMVATNSQMRIEGQYRFQEEGKLEIDLGLGNLTHGPLLRKAVLQGEQLTLTDEKSGLVMKYKRTK